MATVIGNADLLAVAGVSLSASSEAMGLGAQALRTRSIGELWRSSTSGTAEDSLRVALPTAIMARWLVVLAAPRDGVLPGTGALARLTASLTSQDGADVIDTGWLAWAMPLGVWAWLAATPFAARYWRLRLKGVAGDPYKQLGRLRLSDALVTRRGYSPGAQNAPQDAGMVDRARISGVLNVQEGARYRTGNFEIASLDDAEAEKVEDLGLLFGTSGQTFVARDTARLNRGHLGHFAAPLTTTQAGFNRHSASVAFEEEV